MLLQALLRLGRSGVLGRRIEPRSPGQQLEFVQQGLRSDTRRNSMRIPERHARGSA